MTLAQDHPDAFAIAYQKAVDRLQKVSRVEVQPTQKAKLTPATDRHRRRLQQRVRVLQGACAVAADQVLAAAAVLPSVRCALWTTPIVDAC
jgi:hypothetical protein